RLVHPTVWFTPLPDGMAQLGATLDAVIAKSLYDSLDLWARTAQHQGTPSTATTPTGQPSRSLNNYRADALTDLLHHAILHPAGTCTTSGATTTTGATGTAAGTPAPATRFRSWPPARIEIQVPALTLLGRSEDPGHLTGYGPIPPEQARELAAGAHTWTRILTDPATHIPLNLARTSYHPTAAIAAAVRHRDPVCTGIGCDHPAASCELDHTTPFYMNRYRPDGTLEPKGQT
ncbi:DUF222 domain-containing protein, partial [Specibacter sp. RAF43]|uniref:DUF222 domain-containing protein n=1 Tax=Specibacter sp. RAF43 TaxID=3233057 RepID=UPI003F9CBF6F